MLALRFSQAATPKTHPRIGNAPDGEADVCIVCPAYNAAQTLSATIRSVRCQNFSRWCLVIVNDGSTDETLQVARFWAQRDPRIHVVTKCNEGVSSARNYGVAFAKAEWLLFLDADDILHPRALKVLLAKSWAAPEAGVVVGRAARLDRDGRAWPAPRWDLTDAFSLLAYECGIVIHSALVKRNLVLRAGGFDPELRTAEDWDLWQRLARMGVGFAQVERVVAFYLSRPGSLSKDTRRLLRDTLRVMERGVAPDPRVQAQAGFEDGGHRELLDRYVFNFAMWSAAREIAAGRDGVELLKREVRLPDLDVDAQVFADMLAAGMADYLGRRPHELADRWDAFQPKLEALLRFAFPAEPLTRTRELLLLHVKCRLGVVATSTDAQTFDVAALDLWGGSVKADSLPARTGVLQLWGRGPAGLVAFSGTGLLAGEICAQIRTIGLRPALVSLRPWRRASFWAAAAASAVGTARLLLRAASAQPAHVRALAIERARFSVERGVSAAIVSRLKLPPKESGPRGANQNNGPRLDDIASQVPILMYHRVGCARGAEQRYAIPIEKFRQQIEELSARGYRSASTAELKWALKRATPLAGRPIMLTFDDGYADFAEVAWPILREFGFSAVLFPVSKRIGGVSEWDPQDTSPLMNWATLRDLVAEGVEVGSHSCTHKPLTRISLADVEAEAKASMEAISTQLGFHPRVFCYPFGARDILVDRIVSGAGYDLGMSHRPGFCRLTDDPMNLPRIEIAGWESLEGFRRKLRIN